MTKQMVPTKLPPSLITFLKENFHKGSVIPSEFRDSFINNRVDFDETDSLYNATENVQLFLRTYFIFGQILVPALVHKQAMGIAISPTARKNLKVVVSIVYLVVRDYIIGVWPAREIKDDQQYQDGLIKRKLELVFNFDELS